MTERRLGQLIKQIMCYKAPKGRALTSRAAPQKQAIFDLRGFEASMR